jgi:hypothetical protein
VAEALNAEPVASSDDDVQASAVDVRRQAVGIVNVQVAGLVHQRQRAQCLLAGAKAEHDLSLIRREGE